jgi:cupin 2 domain-containing protein
MNFPVKNIFSDIPSRSADELFEPLLNDDQLLLQRIVSQGHATASGQWYDQAFDEWVLILQGSAKILFKDKAKLVNLNCGDYLFIPAHSLHRVEWTDPDCVTIWLALHIK